MATKQDMPPSGGYAAIEYARKHSKRINGAKWLAVAAGCTALGVVHYYWEVNRKKYYDIEMMDARLAQYPFLQAENQRQNLKVLRWNRDEEREMMQYVPKWEVGKYYGVPIYYNTRGRHIEPSYFDLTVFNEKYNTWNTYGKFK